MSGVSVEFFCGAVKLLARQHGEKMCNEPIERFRQALADAEAAYCELLDAPKKTSKKKKPASA